METLGECTVKQAKSSGSCEWLLRQKHHIKKALVPSEVCFPVFLPNCPDSRWGGSVWFSFYAFVRWFYLTGAKRAWQAARGELQPCLLMGSSWLPCLAFLASFISTTSQSHTPILQNSFFWVTWVRFSTYFASACNFFLSFALLFLVCHPPTPTPTLAISQRVLSTESISH